MIIKTRTPTITPVKAQGQCGSRWAFLTIAATEGIIKIATGKLNSLSVQELMDFDKNSEDQGCEGGFPVNGFDYIIKNKGINTEAAYPYQGQGSKLRTPNMEINLG
ncbi:senescence-specific cysteine protease SAG39-like protein, partial [Tanacetum coccineum]